ncbi:hypothetical protein BBJ28_00015073 [Nothophytophthora sp. Chile5]|nr:hypothetical protein BBJ28_00015073 [Nothophytophthora sp. Chile5]
MVNRRGHRVAKVLRVDRADEDFPIRVDTQEMLPLTIMLKRNRDRHDFEISSDAAMKATKKQVASEKAAKKDAGSKKLMSMFFKKPSPHSIAEDGETTGSQSSYLEREESPQKRRDRKPLTPRDNTDPSRSEARRRDDCVPKKNLIVERSRQSEQRRQREDERRKSLKRTRVDFSPKKVRQKDRMRNEKAPRSISKFFEAKPKQEHRPKKRKVSLSKFIDSIEEKQRDCSLGDLNQYLELDKKRLELEEKAKKASDGEATATSKRGGERPAKVRWQQDRQQFRKDQDSGRSKFKAGSMELWLGRSKRQNQLEEGSAITPKPPEKDKQRTLNLAPEQRKSELNFMMERHLDDAAAQSKSSKSREQRGLKLEDRLSNSTNKKRRSLGTLSARPSKGNDSSLKHEKSSFMHKWNPRK